MLKYHAMTVRWHIDPEVKRLEGTKFPANNRLRRYEVEEGQPRHEVLSIGKSFRVDFPVDEILRTFYEAMH